MIDVCSTRCNAEGLAVAVVKHGVVGDIVEHVGLLLELLPNELGRVDRSEELDYPLNGNLQPKHCACHPTNGKPKATALNLSLFRIFAHMDGCTCSSWALVMAICEFCRKIWFWLRSS